MTTEERRAINDFLFHLVQVKSEAFKVGMYITGQALDVAVKKSGWEYADKIERGSGTRISAFREDDKSQSPRTASGDSEGS